jgi:UDP-N-acetylmuramate dehydrogenase
MVLIAGAGDVIDLRDYLAEELLREDFSAFERALAGVDRITVGKGAALNGCSIFPTRGRARYLIDVEDPAGLKAVMTLCCTYNVQHRIAGAGMNSWFSDCGFDGCVIRFRPDCFTQYKVTGDRVEVGCGLSGPRLQEMLTVSGLAGLEFLEGVPGSVGGWLAMNAGAHGYEIRDCVLSIDCINAKNQLTTVSTDDCGFAYRHCKVLDRGIAVSCTLQLKSDESAAIKARRRAFSEKRIPLKGLRTAGSVFRNPRPDSAGRLLDQAGCKGLRIGGAYVTGFHANIVAVDGQAWGSDVAALIQMMQNRVLFNSHILLEPEICGF